MVIIKLKAHLHPKLANKTHSKNIWISRFLWLSNKNRTYVRSVICWLHLFQGAIEWILPILTILPRPVGGGGYWLSTGRYNLLCKYWWSTLLSLNVGVGTHATSLVKRTTRDKIKKLKTQADISEEKITSKRLVLILPGGHCLTTSIRIAGAWHSFLSWVSPVKCKSKNRPGDLCLSSQIKVLRVVVNCKTCLALLGLGGDWVDRLDAR